MINVIKNKYVFLTISGLLVAASIFSIYYFGLKTGIDFSGGVAWQLQFNENVPTREQILEVFPDAIVTPQNDGQFLLRLKTLTEAEKEKSLQDLTGKFGSIEELNFQNIGSVVGDDLRKKAIWAFVLVLVTISVYVALAFRKVSKPVSSWKYGVITLMTLFHDALIPTGLYAILGKFFNAEIDTNFVVAILVVMGFSVHDTIVVFDRVRENLKLSRVEKVDFDSLVNESVNQTLARSINTSLTLVLTLLALLFLGPANLQYFVLTILVGTVVGTYSSIFVASPLLTLWKGRQK
jgi:preprotein translocase subunit SecF